MAARGPVELAAASHQADPRQPECRVRLQVGNLLRNRRGKSMIALSRRRKNVTRSSEIRNVSPNMILSYWWRPTIS